MIEEIFSFIRTGDVLAYQGVMKMEVGNYVGAIRKFNLAVKKTLRIYDAYDVYARIGNCYLNIVLYEKAIDAYKKSIELKPENHKSWAELGVVQRKNGNFKEAVRCYEEAIRINPEYPDIHTNLGANYIYLNELDKAVESLNKAIELDPSFHVSHSNLALALAMLGEFDKAEATAKRAVSLGSKSGKELQYRIQELRDMDDPPFDHNSWIIWNN